MRNQSKLGKNALRLLDEIKAGRNRIFYMDDCPPGWLQIERAGLAVREGTRAILKGSDA